MKRAALIALALSTLLLGAPREATAQTLNWPVRTVRVIVPLSAGAATDVTARLYAEGLAARWRQPVVVENRPGPDALNAVNAFVGASDEHTLLFSFGGPVTINPFLYDKLSYDPARDLVPIVLGTDSFLAIAANAALGINSLGELQARAKAEPGKLNWAATPGMPQFGFAEFLKSAGVAMTYLPYREFGPALQDVSEGRTAVVSTGLLPLLGPAQTGKIKILAVTNRVRAPGAPQVPTAIESGFPDVIAEGFQGFFGWHGMPDALRDRIASDVRAVAAELPAEKLLGMGQIVRAGTPADFIATIEDQRARVRAVMEAGLIEKR